MKRLIVLFVALCLLLAGCSGSLGSDTQSTMPVDMTPNADAIVTEPANDIQAIRPLPDTTMDNLTDAILSVSLEEGDVYVDASGTMQMKLKIFTYDQYDLVDIANLEVGDTIVRHSGEVTVISLEQSETGRISINGGLENDGFDLATNDCGIFYESGFSDAKNWYEIGETTIRVSDDFKGIDNVDLELGEVVIYPNDFLDGTVTNYDFTPYNTTVRVEAGQIVEMHRAFTP
jgi:hypothetical protein